MYDIFGEFDSCKEINELAENLCNEGDTKNLIVLAMENGIDEEVARMYIRGEVPYLCTETDAALGKIEVEKKDLQPKEIMLDWISYLEAQVMENQKMALDVRRKGKSLKGMIAALLSWSFKNQQQIDKQIMEAAGVKARKVTLGIPGMGRAKKIIKEYYGE